MISTIQTSGVWNGGKITEDMYAEMQGAMLTSAKGIANRAKQLVPVGDLGAHPEKAADIHLRDTIRAVGRRKRSRLETLARGIVSGIYETALPGAWVFAGFRRLGVYWAHWVEFGTYSKPARPFLRPAADAGFNPTLAEADRAGRRVVNKRRRTRVAARKAGIEGLRR